MPSLLMSRLLISASFLSLCTAPDKETVANAISSCDFNKTRLPLTRLSLMRCLNTSLHSWCSAINSRVWLAIVCTLTNAMCFIAVPRNLSELRHRPRWQGACYFSLPDILSFLLFAIFKPFVLSIDFF
jgi:hypothetical protein